MSRAHTDRRRRLPRTTRACGCAECAFDSRPRFRARVTRERQAVAYERSADREEAP